MNSPHNPPAGCRECNGGGALDFDFTMAFQPIVDTANGKIFAHEALVRGLQREPAYQVFAKVNDSNLYRFDQTCRVKAVKMAAKLGMDSLLSINFMPNAVYRPELCIRTTLNAAEIYEFPVEKIVFEITESEKVEDHEHLRHIVEHYKDCGFKTAIDDFGAGYAGLNLLSDIQTDFIKLDMALVQGIDSNKPRQAIVRGILQVCADLGITAIAEGVERREEFEILQDFGIDLFQGFYFARPAFEALGGLAGDAPGWSPLQPKLQALAI